MKQVFLLLLLLPLLVNGQKLTIKIINDDDKPIPYCSISWNRGMGLVTDTSGKIEIPDISKIDSLIIQSLGYEQKIFSRSEIPLTENFVVKLKAKIIVLPEVIIWKTSAYKEFGVTIKKEGFIFFKHNICTNVQLAVKISGYTNPARLDNVSVFISGSSEEDLPFRVRAYEMNEYGLPGEDMLNENIIVKSYKKGKWNTIDLSPYSLGKLPDSGFFVSVELLCDDLNKRNGLCIAGTDEIDSRITFFKNGNANWTSFNSPSPNKRNRPTNFLIKAKLGFPAK